MIRSRLHNIMGDRRLKLVDVQRITGLAYGTLHEIYHGRQERMGYSTLDALCKGLDCQPSDLLEYLPEDGSE